MDSTLIRLIRFEYTRQSVDLPYRDYSESAKAKFFHLTLR